MLRRTTRRFALLCALAMFMSTLSVGPVSAQADATRIKPLLGSSFELQNNFNAGGELTPFFEPQTGIVGPGQEVDNYIYDMNFFSQGFKMSWNTDAEWDQYEPYVGAIAGLSQEDAAAAGIADEYHITFDVDISDVRFSVTPNSALQPTLVVDGDHKLIIGIPGGTDIGDGIDARILARPPVKSLKNLDFSLQNYFSQGGELTPFFDPQLGTVGSGVEVADGYIYAVDVANRSINMTWNTDAAWDGYEPYVGAIAGLSQQEAAAAGIFDEHHFTFSEKVSHLTPKVTTGKSINPDIRFEDDYTVVVSIPGGTETIDGSSLRVVLR